MNEEMQQPPAAPAGAAEEVLEQADPVTTFLEALTTAVGVETVFGEPITVGDRVIIPVAETSLGGGVGFGRGPGPEGEPQTRTLALGGGAGGGATTRPVAAIVVTADGVRVQPVIDVGKLALTSIASTAALWQGLAVFVRSMHKRR
jgi:uncharacterized spore protein YtfJ